MKKCAISLLAASALLVGCNQSVQTASDQFNALPSAVQKTARAQAPNAEITSVTQITTNGMMAYEIEFSEQGGSPKIVVGQNGTLLSSELPNRAGVIQKLLTPTGAIGTPFSALPVAAQKTIQDQAPHAEITGISRHDENGRMVYEVKFKDHTPIQVASDGALVEGTPK
ncbi:MAG TPA: PepSY-like domain-containing protein [Verrucomicrobiae bacterium]|nr:PepSY-like domain-containing protein [Verrucomicrobiae bacterium]